MFECSAAVRKAVRSEREAAERRKNGAIQLGRSNATNQVAAFERGGNAIGNIEKQLRMRYEIIYYRCCTFVLVAAIALCYPYVFCE